MKNYRKKKNRNNVKMGTGKKENRLLACQFIDLFPFGRIPAGRAGMEFNLTTGVQGAGFFT
jgi:hypothetical protein